MLHSDYTLQALHCACSSKFNRFAIKQSNISSTVALAYPTWSRNFFSLLLSFLSLSSLKREKPWPSSMKESPHFSLLYFFFFLFAKSWSSSIYMLLDLVLFLVFFYIGTYNLIYIFSEQMVNLLLNNSYDLEEINNDHIKKWSFPSMESDVVTRFLQKYLMTTWDCSTYISCNNILILESSW